MRWLVVAALASCHASGESANTTTIRAYEKLVTEACHCTDAACAHATDTAWLQNGAASEHHYSDAEKTWLTHLGLHFEQCQRRARGEPYEIVEY